MVSRVSEDKGGDLPTGEKLAVSHVRARPNKNERWPLNFCGSLAPSSFSRVARTDTRML